MGRGRRLGAPAAAGGGDGGDAPGPDDRGPVAGMGIRCPGPVRPDTRSWIAVTDSSDTKEESEGHRSDLEGTPDGDQSMTGTPETGEDVYPDVRQDPRARVKAGLPEAQSPARQGHLRRTTSDAATPTGMEQAGRSITSFGGRAPTNEAGQGDERATYVALGRPRSRKQGIALRPRGRG